MIDNAYKTAMKNVRFDEQFTDKTAARLTKLAPIVRRAQRRKKLAYFCAGAVCILVLPLLIITSHRGLPAKKDMQLLQNPPNGQPSIIENQANEPGSAPLKQNERKIVVSSDYKGGEMDYMAPKQGQVMIMQEIRNAMEDKKNENSFFFVHIRVIPPERYANSFGGYIFGGRSISDWSELVDLSNEAYPYNEYNGDHGGNITKEQWRELQEESKKLHAQENYDAAVKEYRAIVEPMLAKADQACEKKEGERLTELGYDVSFTETWSYTGQAQKKVNLAFTGLLSKKQLTEFAADKTCGYVLDWVRNGEGVMDMK